jgi:hypothetical protein
MVLDGKMKLTQTQPLNRLDNRPPGGLNFLFETGFTKVGDD